MDVRVTRRAAEKAARTLINDRAGLVGELGVADAGRTRLLADLEAAVTQGRELVAAAEQEATRLLVTAQNDLADGETRYATARTAATEGGWLTADLAVLNYPAPRAKRPRSGHRTTRAEEVAMDAGPTGGDPPPGPSSPRLGPGSDGS